MTKMTKSFASQAMDLSLESNHRIVGYGQLHNDDFKVLKDLKKILQDEYELKLFAEKDKLTTVTSYSTWAAVKHFLLNLAKKQLVYITSDNWEKIPDEITDADIILAESNESNEAFVAFMEDVWKQNKYFLRDAVFRDFLI